MPVCRVCDTPANKTSLRTFLSMRPVQKRFGIRYNNNSALYFGCTKATLILYKKEFEGGFVLPAFCTATFILGQHRTIRQEVSDRIFAQIQSSENGGILYVFPIFGTAEVEQKDG